MNTSASPDYQREVIAQFTRQAAAPWSKVPAITNSESLKLLLELSGATGDDTMLDVACGAGVVVCAFAKVVRHATGIDLTPAMIKRAGLLEREAGLDNVRWQIGAAAPLPFPTAAFSLVVSRYAFHHFPNPLAVMTEMGRVCQPGGRVLLADVYTSGDPAQAAAYNHMEKLRDPAHVRAMPLAELEQLVRTAGLRSRRTAFYGLEMELEALLEVSFPHPGDADRIRQMFAEELDSPRMGVGVERKGAALWFTYPIAVIVAEKRSD